MTQDKKIPATSRNLGTFLIAKALRGDWEEVRAGIPKMCSLRQVESQRGVTDLLNPLLALYAKAHTIEETENFVQMAVEEYGLIPNRLTLNIMVNAFARRGEFESVQRWIEYVKPFGVTADSV